VALPAAELHAPHAPPEGQYERHQPEKTVLYQVVAEHWPAFLERAEEMGGLPRFVEREVEEFAARRGTRARRCVRHDQ